MNLVGYTATALSRNDITDTPTDKNVVSGAIVELKTPQGYLVTIYDDSAGNNPETQKTCDSDGQCTFYAEGGDYNLEINGISQLISLGINKAALDDAVADTLAFATSEADRAETAADVAMTAGWVYASVAGGEAVRADGEYFWVVSADDSEVLELWEMGASSATDTSKRTASKKYTDTAIINEVNQNSLMFGGANSDFSENNDYVATVGSPTFDVNATESNAMFLSFDAGISQSVGLSGALSVSTRYYIEIEIKSLSGQAVPLQVGRFTSSLSYTQQLIITPSEDYKTYCGFFETSSGSSDFNIGVAGSMNPSGASYAIKNVKVYDLSVDSTSNAISDKFIRSSLNMSNLLDNNSSSMSSVGGWLGGIGSPVFNVNSTVAGSMYLNLSGAEANANKAVFIHANMMKDKNYSVSVSIKKRTGSSCPFRVGFYSSGAVGEDTFIINPSDKLETYTGFIKPTEDNFRLFIGVLGAENTIGGTYEISEVVVTPITEKDLSQDLKNSNAGSENKNTPLTFNTEQFMQSLSRYDKPLTRIAVTGDSLMANSYGGFPPLDEGEGKRPIRLDVNTVARQVYDLISWNKPEHRRLDDAAWTNSGTWSTINDNSLWVGFHSFEKYHVSTDPSAYTEVTIPDGMENFALIVHRRPNMGKLNVTLNGGDVSTYGEPVIDMNRAAAFTNETGCAMFTIEYLNLPSGANTLRFTKEANTDEVRVWGGFYWSGNTAMVYLAAQGGHTMGDLISQGHFEDDIKDNKMDAVLFELPTMNEMSKGNPTTQSLADLDSIHSAYLSKLDHCIMSAWPFGERLSDGQNLYLNYTDPTQKETSDALRDYCYDKGLAFIDVFNIWVRKVQNRGGTLGGGETGVWYTTDGQHPNSDGGREWFNMIKFAMQNKTIS